MSLRPPLTDLADAPTFNEIFEQLQLLTLAVYTPLAYVFPSRRDKYEQLYGAGAGTNYMGGQTGNLGAASREQGIRKLMTVNLLKRLESSIEAFRLTLNRLEFTVAEAIEAVDNHAANIADIVSAFTDIDAEDDDFDVPHQRLGRQEGADRPGRHGCRVVEPRPRQRRQSYPAAPRLDQRHHARPRLQAPAGCAT